MKKFIFAVLLLTGISVYSNAQSTHPNTKTPANTTSIKPAAASAAKPATTSAGPTKKDGSADMRYKSNKEAAKATPVTTHTKKDGTPDQRYKENKK